MCNILYMVYKPFLYVKHTQFPYDNKQTPSICKYRYYVLTVYTVYY